MFESASDAHINELIKCLCNEAERCTFVADQPKKQKLIDQIVQLRTSQNPTIIMKPE